MSFENLILATLQASPGTVVPRAALESAVYGDRPPAKSNVIEVEIGRLRKAHGKDRIKTHRGVGYSWEAES